MAEAPEPQRDLDWDAKRAREFGERALDVWTEYLEGLPSFPVKGRWNSHDVREAVTFDVPDRPLPDDELFEHVRRVVLEYATFTGSPRFMAYITGAGTVPGAAADLLAAAVNQNVGGWRLSPAATEIELHLTRWFARRFGLPEETAAGLIVSGGAMANFAGLKVARDHRGGWDLRHDGVAAGPPLAAYISTEAHHVLDRACDMLGLGERAVRHIPVDGEYRMRVDALSEAIERDLAEGVKPILVVGTGGTVATGHVDPLSDIADVCERHGLWFHVDGAYGGPAILADELRPLFAGIERADSIAFDPHKWLYTPHSGGCVLFRDLQQAVDSFSLEPSYIHADKERSGFGFDLLQAGPQFSRGFWAFKVWISLLAHGREAYARRIGHDVALARYLGERAEERPDFERMAPVELSICVFRYVPPDLPEGNGREEYLSMLNERIMTEVWLDGRVFYSNAVLGDRFVLRVCIVNFRTEAEDIDAVLDVTAEIGAKLDAELRPEGLR